MPSGLIVTGQLYSFASRSCMLQPTTLAYDPAELTAMITLGGLTTSTQFSPFFARHIARARTDKVFLELLKQLETVFLGGLPLSEDDEIFCLQEGVKVQVSDACRVDVIGTDVDAVRLCQHRMRGASSHHCRQAAQLVHSDA